MPAFIRNPLASAILAMALFSVPAHAVKWASATLHTNKPIDQVFDPTSKLIAEKEWYSGTRWHIQSIDKSHWAIQATTVSFGQQWGDIYVWMSQDGTGTTIQTVMTLYAGAHLHPADYAIRFGKGLTKLFPDLTYEVKRDITPTNFYFGDPQVSIPTVPTAVSSELPSISVTQNAMATQIIQVGQPNMSFFTALATIEQDREEKAELRDRQIDEEKTRKAVSDFLNNEAQTMSHYLATVGGDSTEQFRSAAQEIDRARDVAYAELANPVQRAKFNRITNPQMLAFAREMSGHAKEQALAYRADNQDHVAEDLHRALDAWYANGKDWTKIPTEIWNKLSERDRGRLKDGIDPEVGVKR